MTSFLPSTRTIFHIILRPTFNPTPTLYRKFSTSLILSNKASKSRIQRSALKSNPDKERLRGTGVGASDKVYGKKDNVVGKPTAGQGLFEESSESFGGGTSNTGEETKMPERGEESVEGMRGSGVGASKELYPEEGEVNARDEVGHTPKPAQGTPSTASAIPSSLKASPPTSFLEHHQRHHQSVNPSPSSHETEGETIYTAKAPFNVPLVLTTAFVFSVFALCGADMARTSYSSYNSEKEEYELAPRWKRYTFATGFLAVAIATITWGSLLPARVVTKLSLLRPLPLSPSSSMFPKGSKLVIHTPVTKLPGLSPRVVELERVALLGPLSEAPRPWHPKESSHKHMKKESKGFLSSLLSSSTPSSSRSSPKAFKSSWDGPARSHVPIVVQGDRASYSLMRTRNTSGEEGDHETGAWCRDWEGLEKALLGVKG